MKLHKRWALVTFVPIELLDLATKRSSYFAERLLTQVVFAGFLSYTAVTQEFEEEKLKWMHARYDTTEMH